jgi:butyryl-CoA dehydrogenase
MEFKLTKEQEAIRRMMREFAERKLAPIAAQIDRDAKIPPDVYPELRKLKLFGIPYDKKYGGGGESYAELVLVIEEVAKASAAVSLMLAGHYLAPISLRLYGTEEQKERCLPKLCSGEGIGTLAFTESATGSDPEAITTVAELSGDDYILNGSKRFITNAPLDGLAIIFAKTDNGVSAFIVNKNQPGYSTSKPWEMMGLRGGQVADIQLKDVRIPKANLLGSEGKGYRMLTELIAYGKVNVSACLLGIGEAALDEAIKYAKETTARGKPIANFQTIQCLIADIETQVEAARWLTYRLAYLASQGGDIRHDSALTKLFASEMATAVTNKALQVHGSYGYTKEFKIERLYRDARFGEIIEGVSEIQRVIIAASLLR